MAKCRKRGWSVGVMGALNDKDEIAVLLKERDRLTLSVDMAVAGILEDALGGVNLSQDGDEDMDEDEEYGEQEESSSDEEGAEGMVDDTEWHKKKEEGSGGRERPKVQKRKRVEQTPKKTRKKTRKDVKAAASDKAQPSPKEQHEVNVTIAKSASKIVASLSSPQPTIGAFYSHATSSKTRQKAQDILTNVFYDRMSRLVDAEKDIGAETASYAVWLAFCVEAASWEALGGGREYQEKVMSLKHNLASNTSLCDAVLTLSVSASELVKMSKEDMAGEELKRMIREREAKFEKDRVFGKLEDLEGKRGKAVQDKFEEPAVEVRDETRESESYKKKPLPQPVESVPDRASTPPPPPKRKKKNLGALMALHSSSTPAVATADTTTTIITASSSLREPKFSKPARLHSPTPPIPETGLLKPKPLPPPLTSADDFPTDSAFSPLGDSEDEGPPPPGDFSPSFLPLHANPKVLSKYSVKFDKGEFSCSFLTLRKTPLSRRPFLQGLLPRLITVSGRVKRRVFSDFLRQKTSSTKNRVVILKISLSRCSPEDKSAFKSLVKTNESAGRVVMFNLSEHTQAKGYIVTPGFTRDHDVLKPHVSVSGSSTFLALIIPRPEVKFVPFEAEEIQAASLSVAREDSLTMKLSPEASSPPPPPAEPSRELVYDSVTQTFQPKAPSKAFEPIKQSFEPIKQSFEPMKQR